MTAARLLRFALWRLVQAIPVVLGVCILCFLMLQLAPGDLAEVLAGESGGASPGYIEALRARYGLDKPVLVQLFIYMKNVLLFDLGFSFRHNADVSSLLAERLVPTLLLMGSTLVLSVGLGALAGLFASIWINTWKDHAISLVAIVAYATPLFWVGLMLILAFSIKLDWFPTSGMENVVMFYEGWNKVLDVAHHLVLPCITLSLFYMALYARLMRATMLEQRGLDYVTTARAKGLTERRITFRHVLRNALLPVVTMAGVQVGGLLGGSVVVESVFAWPGLGQLAFEALFSRDYNLLLGIFLLSACLVVLVNILVDILYVVLDPRIKVGE